MFSLCTEYIALEEYGMFLVLPVQISTFNEVKAK